MMEIKFRAWIIDEDKMVYAGCFDNPRNYYIRNDGRLFRIVKLSDKNGQNFLSIETKCEIMQYTGLKDKNGKEIWESDIALIFGVKSEIRYSNTWCGWVFFDKDRPIELQELPFYDGTKGNYTECEIIGNIYDLGNQSK